MRPPDRTRTRRRWRALAPLAPFALAPLALALPSTLRAAAFLPGVAEPPAGPGLVVPAGPTAEEPLQGDGFRFVLAPWRASGSLVLDARTLRDDTARRETSLLQIGEVDFASHLWQPWFVQLRAGFGWIAARSRVAGPGDAGGAATVGGNGSGDGLSLTGRAAIAVFPASRFPFELRVDRSDSRSGGLALGGDYRSTRLSLSQSWRSAVDGSSAQFVVDRSRLDREGLADTLLTWSATAQLPVGAHRWELGLSRSDHHSSDSDERTTLDAAHVRHSLQPTPELQLESMASRHDATLERGGRESGSEVRQVSSFLSWRAPAGPLVAGSARWLQTQSRGEGVGSPAVQAVNATLGASLDLARDWRAGVSASANRLEAADEQAQSAGLQGTLAWVPPASVFGAWRWTPNASAQLGANRDSRLGRRRIVGVQAGHALTRDLELDARSLLTFGLTQGAAALDDDGIDETQRSLAHGASLGWRRYADDGSQGLASLSWSESRTLDAGDGRFEIVNLQLSQRLQLTRHSSWNASLTAQATRNRSTQVDAFTGERRASATGWQHFTSGSAGYEHARAFDVPRLRAALLLTVQSQPIARRAAGDIDAEQDRITHAFEARLDWAVGLLETRVALRVARFDGRDLAALQARAQRRF